MHLSSDLMFAVSLGAIWALSVTLFVLFSPNMIMFIHRKHFQWKDSNLDKLNVIEELKKLDYETIRIYKDPSKKMGPYIESRTYVRYSKILELLNKLRNA